MASRRRVAGGLAVVVVVLAAVYAIGEFRSDDSTAADTVVALTDFASDPPSSVPATTSATNGTAPEFPAIVDSAIRDPAERVEPAAADFEVLEVVDHDPTAFTQGLELAGPRLFESTGLVGQSTVREVDPTTGVVLRSREVPGVFAEGLTIVGDQLLQLTWTEEVAFRYDLETFEIVTTHTYEGQGWGLCHDGARLVMSDGSPTLTFRDTATFAPTGSVEVTFNGAPVPRLNELECVGPTVWANIWLTPLIIEIDPDSGQVLTVLDASELWPDSVGDDTQAVLNGIAHDPATETFLLTGKRWPVTYRVRIEIP